jgi:hypothetical protein
MNNKTTTTKPSAPADKSAQLEEHVNALNWTRDNEKILAWQRDQARQQLETAAVMLSDILNTIEVNDFSFVSLRWIHMHGKATLAVLEREAR